MEEITTTDEKNMRSYPVIEDADKEFECLKIRNFNFTLPEDNKIVTLGVGNVVTREEMLYLRLEILDICKKYGFGNVLNSNLNTLFTKMDKEIGEFIYSAMNITPSFAASLPMWHFLNLYLIPDVIKWRWGENKDHFISSRRNYLGTQWWRYHLFNVTKHSIKKYMQMNDRDIADLYERTNSRGLPEHIANISLWFEELDKENVSGKSQELYREVLKAYNAQLAYRLYFALTTQDRLELFSKCYKQCLRKM